MKKIFIFAAGGLFFSFFMAGVVFAGAGGSNLTLLESGENYIKVKAEASVITTEQYELEFEDEAENPRPGEYVITLNAFEVGSAFSEDTDSLGNIASAASPMTFLLYNPIEGSNTVRIEVNPPGDFSENVFATSQEFVFSKSPLPDLTITRFIPQVTASGKEYAVVDIINQGNADVSGPVKVICGFWDSDNDRYKEKRSFSIRKQFTVKGYIYTKKIPLRKKSSFLGYHFAYQCTVDPANLIEESDEDNNTFSMSSIEESMWSNPPEWQKLQTSILTIQTTEKTINLAKCLTQNGVKLYGASWCPYCKQQKAIFGYGAAKELDYVECYPITPGDLSKTCADAKIEAFPTWDFGNGNKWPGYLTLEQIAEKTGCPY